MAATRVGLGDGVNDAPPSPRSTSYDVAAILIVAAPTMAYSSLFAVTHSLRLRRLRSARDASG